MILTTDRVFYETTTKLTPVEFVDKLEHSKSAEVLGLVVRLGTNVDRAAMWRFPKLRFVATITTGLDHIDMDAAQECGVQVLSLKGELEFLQTIRATPEHTWALLMALTRQIRPALDSVLRGHWSREGLFGQELNQKTLGIVGFGRVGKQLSIYAQAFGMHICAHDLPGMPGINGVEMMDLESLMRQSDYVACCLPLEETTKGFIGLREFKWMGEGKKPFFLNTARGAVVDERALIWALQGGFIAGAGLDVLDGEVDFAGTSSQHPLVTYARTHSNLLITPHIAGSTHESLIRTAAFIEDKILRSGRAN